MSASHKHEFHIMEDLCLTCRAPEAVAPDLIGFYDDPDPGKSHCYLKKQPSSPEEFARAVEAVRACCCGAYRYRGSNAVVRRSLGWDSVD